MLASELVGVSVFLHVRIAEGVQMDVQIVFELGKVWSQLFCDELLAVGAERLVVQTQFYFLARLAGLLKILHGIF